MELPLSSDSAFFVQPVSVRPSVAAGSDKKCETVIAVDTAVCNPRGIIKSTLQGSVYLSEHRTRSA